MPLTMVCKSWPALVRNLTKEKQERLMTSTQDNFLQFVNSSMIGPTLSLLMNQSGQSALVRLLHPIRRKKHMLLSEHGSSQMSLLKQPRRLEFSTVEVLTTKTREISLIKGILTDSLWEVLRSRMLSRKL